MRTAINILIALSVLLLSPTWLTAQTNSTRNVIDNATEALKRGDADMLSRHFSTTIEIDLLGDENFYSRSQATLLIKSFVTKHQPVEFSLTHEGIKETTAFAIGALRTENNTFRVSIFIKTEGGQPYIHQLRIERNSL